jgi:hypothetical protein
MVWPHDSDSLCGRRRRERSGRQGVDDRFCSVASGVELPYGFGQVAGIQRAHAELDKGGVLLGAVLPDWVGELEGLAKVALSDPDPWRGFAEFLNGLFLIQAGNRSVIALSNGDDAVWRRHLGFLLDGLRAR